MEEELDGIPAQLCHAVWVLQTTLKDAADALKRGDYLAAIEGLNAVEHEAEHIDNVRSDLLYLHDKALGIAAWPW